MDDRVAKLLAQESVANGLRQAWLDSNPGASGGHEERGFIVRENDGTISTVRWRRGGETVIFVPPHPQGRLGESEIIATFHTHPNSGDEFKQSPSRHDRNAVMIDKDLKTKEFVGEFVISSAIVYLIDQRGLVTEIGNRVDLFGEPGES